MKTTETEFSPGALAGCDDPYALLAEQRALGTVLRSAGSWLVLGYHEAHAVLRSSTARTGFIAELYRAILPEGAAREEMSHRINFLDPPDHTRVRGLVGKAFTPRRVSALRPYVAELSRELLEPFEAGASVDLIRAFAHQVPSLVISELLGVPVEDRDKLTKLSDRVSALLGLAGLTPEAQADAVDAAEEMHAYLRALLEERRAAPGDDLLSALLAAEENGVTLSESEMLSLAATLYSAGHRTTRDLFSNGLAALLADRESVAGVVSGEISPDHAIEEFLRFETPTHYVARMLTEPMLVGETMIPAGEPIAILLAAANRDPEVYTDSDRFDPRRWSAPTPPPPPLSFAFGPHFCIGASLARLEAQVMLKTLLSKYPNVQLAEPPLRWRHTGLFRGLESLPVIPEP